MPKQPRERAVPCKKCRKDTWSPDAICDRCRKPSFDEILQTEIEKIRKCDVCGEPATVWAVDEHIAGGWGDPFCDGCAKAPGLKVIDKV